MIKYFDEINQRDD